MKRIIVGIFWILAALISGRSFSATDPIEVIALAAVRPGGTASKQIFYATGDEFKVVSIESRDGKKFVRLERSHLGVPVVYDLVRLQFTPTGDLLYAACALKAPIEISEIKQNISSTEAEEYALSQFPYQNGKLRGHAHLVIYHDSVVTPTLAYMVRIDGRQVDGTPSHYMAYVSTQARQILGTDDDTRTISPVSMRIRPSASAKSVPYDTPIYIDNIATGKTFYSGTQVIHDALNTYDGSYALQDLTRGGDYVVNATDLYTRDTNIWGSSSLRNIVTAAADAAYVHQKAWDYFASSFGYKGYDGNGLAGVAWVHYLNGGAPYRNAAFTIEDSSIDPNPEVPNGTPEILYGDGDIDTYPFIALEQQGVSL